MNLKRSANMNTFIPVKNQHMSKIAIQGMEFYAYHGFYPNERKKGNRFIVNISLKLNYTKAAERDTIRHTVNYEKVYKICQNHMKKPKKLLETVSHNIGETIIKKFPVVQKIRVEVHKLNPPLPGPVDRFSVYYETKRKNNKK